MQSHSIEIPDHDTINDCNVFRCRFELVGCRMLRLTKGQAEQCLHLYDAGSFSLVTSHSLSYCHQLQYLLMLQPIHGSRTVDNVTSYSRMLP